MIDFIYETLAQIGFRHPLHPAITHFPMGMVFGGFVFAFVAFVFKKEELIRTAHHCFTLGLIFVLPTMVLGYMDWQYKFGAEWSNLIMAKIIMAFIFYGLLFIAFFIGKKEETNIKKKLVIYFICAVFAVSMGYLGGEIQYG